MKFTKMQGCGNDYLFLDCTRMVPPDLPQLAVQLSDRHFGPGGDGLICVFPSKIADVRMVMFNADGSEGAMCGNGIRCLGKYVWDRKIVRKTEMLVETKAGIRAVDLCPQRGEIVAATVHMGHAVVREPIEMQLEVERVVAVPVLVGNPHLVIEVSDPAAIPLSALGPTLEHWPVFEGGQNVEFVRIDSEARLTIRVWERGSGITLACGTGACASVAALCSQGKCGQHVTVRLPGGEVRVRIKTDGEVLLNGPCATVYDGELSEPSK